MEAKRLTERAPGARIDWESFYVNYRKPGYVSGFEIINKLGGGVFGMVFKARKESIGKDYAIKFLKVDDEVVRDAVVRELDAVRFFAQVDHPNLVSIEDKGEVDGIPYIVMSYAGEGTLRKRLQSGPLSRDEALRIFIQAARGVQALHDRSLVHFDLKPANIFLKGDIARVGDYGLSKLVTESRNSLSFGRGTPYYMAPEMLQRRGDARSDIYSLGVILYECLTGDVPFKGESEWEVLRKHEIEPPHYPETVTSSDRQFIDRCLAKNPDDRFASAAELLRALQAPAALGESLVFARPAPTVGFSFPTPPAPPAGLVGRNHTAAVEAVRNPQDSPYGMPWRSSARLGLGLGSVIGGAVHVAFRAIEVAIMVLLVPVRAVSIGLGHGLIFLLQLPLRLLGLVIQLVAYVLLASSVLAVVLGLFYLLGAILR